MFPNTTTHLIANIEDLTKVLIGEAEEMEDLEEETEESWIASRKPRCHYAHGRQPLSRSAIWWIHQTQVQGHIYP